MTSERKNSSKNIVLIGFMGSGKSSVAKELHNQSSKNVIELDDEIVKLKKMSISDIFSRYGEACFRETETSVLSLLHTQKNIVLSCGGGTILKKENVLLMRQIGRIFYLTASPEIILDRVRESNSRPILNGNMNLEYIQDLLKSRQKAYLSAADVIISTDNKTVPEICREVLQNI